MQYSSQEIFLTKRSWSFLIFCRKIEKLKMKSGKVSTVETQTTWLTNRPTIPTIQKNALTASSCQKTGLAVVTAALGICSRLYRVENYNYAIHCKLLWPLLSLSKPSAQPMFVWKKYDWAILSHRTTNSPDFSAISSWPSIIPGPSQIVAQ